MSEAEEIATVHQCNETTVAFDRSADPKLSKRRRLAARKRSLVCEDRSLAIVSLSAGQWRRQRLWRAVFVRSVVGLY
jgi:hypothetical protein